MRFTPIRLFRPAILSMALHPPQNPPKLICISTPPSPPSPPSIQCPTTNENHSRTRQQQNQFPSRTIHPNLPLPRRTRPHLPIHPIPHLVHNRPNLRRPPTRDSLSLNRLPSFRTREFSRRVSEGIRRDGIRDIFQLRNI